MSAFVEYADWYDLFYVDKDYLAEARYVDGLLRNSGVIDGELLEIGCGTGAHAEALVEQGWHVTGIDLSEEMLAWARNRFNVLPKVKKEMGHFIQGDARTFNLARQFDAVISLFHVMSYQAGQDDLLLALETVRRHLKPGSVFVFDFWYGPAVLTQLPEHRLRRVENERFVVHRFVSPVLRENENVVNVQYDFVVMDKIKKSTVEIREIHRMRYLFLPEVRMLAKVAGFNEVAVKEWMTGLVPDRQSWNVCAVLR